MSKVSKPLTPQQQLFVDEYMKDRNAMQAAIRAKYSAKTARQIGSRLLTNVDIAAEIERRIESYSKTAGLEVVVILEEAKKIAFSDIAGAFDENGALLPVHKMPETARAAIASIKVTEMAGGMEITIEGGPRHVPMYTKEVKLWDKPAALFKLLDFIKGVPAPGPTCVTNNVQINAQNAIMDLRALQAPARAAEGDENLTKPNLAGPHARPLG